MMKNQNNNEYVYINMVFVFGVLIAVTGCMLIPINLPIFIGLFLIIGYFLGAEMKKHVSSRKHLACWLYGYVATVVWGISFSGYISHRIGSLLFMIAFFLMYKLARKIKKEKEQVQH